jgi:type I restriction enzyme, R subunit
LTEELGMAVCELDTDTGPADYMLFVDGAACGITEAKREGSELEHVDIQSQRYTTSLTKHTNNLPVPEVLALEIV